MKVEYDYNIEKNIKLKSDRGISFEEIIYYINNGCLIDTVEHPNKDKYAGQHFYIVDVDDYIYMVPFVQEGHKIFLKTIFPSKKQTKKYLDTKGKKHE